ncbi:MAG: hypothetical protein PHT75_02335 [Bacilli bacterium]|nr:hypothetical protein [Bacilli bacterium]MDD3304950.1 hypothetical protein [Bacilli bacterium]MDD4054062.1 hypothetical protein [Bacilli bacterium]MDD4411417.1 hypothetical protein [Bacilli bacterium]
MGIILNLFLLSIGSIFGSVYLNKRYEEMLPMTVMVIIFTLFIFYMLSIPLIGYYLLILAGVILVTLSGLRFYKDKDIRKQALDNFFTPGLLIFTVVSFLIWFVTKENFVMYFDELRLWALYPKSIFVSNELMMGSDLYFSTDYLPGMPLFQYFFAKNVGHFAESHLYLSYALVVLSLLMPITKKIKWKNFWAIIPAIILLFTFPMLFANSGFDGQYYYKALYIDPVLGILFGYSLFLSTQDLKRDKFKHILFSLSLSMVILMKIVGIVLVGCVILSYLFNQIFIYKSYKLKFKKKNIKNYVKLFIPIFLAMFTFLSWHFVTKLNFEAVQGHETISASRITDSLQLFLNPNTEQKEFISSYISYIDDNAIIRSDSSYSSLTTVPNICLFFLLIMGLLYFSVVKNKRKIIISASVFGIFSIIIFLLFYLYIYVFTFHSTILCYGRYIGAVISGISVLTLLLIFESSYKLKNNSVYYFLLSLLILLYVTSLPKISTVIFGEKEEMETNNYAAKIVSTLDDNNNDVNLFTVYNYCDAQTYTCVLYQHHLFLSLIDKGIYSRGIYLASEGVVPPEFYIPIIHDDITFHLRDHDYVLIVEDIENIEEESEGLFGESPKAGEFFKKIIDEDGVVSMKKIADF